MVVNNDSTDHTAQVARSFSKQGLPVQMVVEKKLGYPYVYNRGLIATKQDDWVCFIDDDCVADQAWYAELILGIKRHPHAAAVIGATNTQDFSNLWSLATWCFDQIWKQSNMSASTRSGDSKIIDLEVLDNKNIAYNQRFLQTSNIRFNEAALLVDGIGAAEDADLGMQIALHGGTAWFLSKAVVAHKDPNTFSWYCKKIMASARAISRYRSHWSAQRNNLPNARVSHIKFRLFRQWRSTCRKYKLSFFAASGLLVALFYGSLLFKLVQWSTKFRSIKVG